MRVAVIGAGVVGVASAYLLARRGHTVTLLDAASAPGTGTSAGNAAQLSWAYGDAMASPALLKHLPAIAMGRDPAFRIRWRLDPDFLLWGLRFLANASEARWWNNTRDILALAEESRHELVALLSEVDLAFDYRPAGKLHLHADRSRLAAARAIVERKRGLGIEQSVVSREAAIDIEPALRDYGGEIAGAVWTPGDALGDAAAFCRNLTAHIVNRYGVETRFGTRVAGFERSGERLSAIRFADCEPLSVGAAVVTAGNLSHAFAGDLPEARAIQPVRGYSLTVPWRTGMPRVSLTDIKRKLAFAAIGERFRVAGLADIDRPGAGFDPTRFEVLRDTAQAALPGYFDAVSNDGIRWSGERPMTPSSKPVIGPSRRLRGLYLNAGHGMLGWTLALGSAGRLCSLIEE